MSAYDLLEHQKKIVREMVAVYQDTGQSNFFYVGSSAGFQILFDTKPQRRSVELSFVDDLHVLEQEGLVTLRLSPSTGQLAGGSLKQSAVDAVAADFKRPSLGPAGIIQNYYAPVGAVHAGVGEIKIDVQNIGIGGDELIRLMESMRDALAELPAQDRSEAAELIDALEGEVRTQVPKQSRVKAFIGALWGLTNGVTTFTSSLLTIAQAYGIKPETLRQITFGP